VLSSSLHGPLSADWHLAPPYSTPQDSNSLLDTSSLLPITTSSSTVLADSLIAPDSSLYATSDWNLFPTSDSPYLGHETQLFPGGSTSLSTAEDTMKTLAMPSGMEFPSNMNTSSQMTRDCSQSGSSWTSHKDRSSSSPEHISSSKLQSTKSSPVIQEPASRIEKRKANTLAARRYRQKRVDQMSSLEAELKQIKAERDELKVRNARLEGEVETLRALLRSQK
jgi:hypothetical protein